MIVLECLQESIVITLPKGKIDGSINISKNNVTFYSYIGIPFAAPPIGKLRFQVSKSLCTK